MAKTRTESPDDAVKTLKQVLDSIRRYRPFILRMIVVGALLAVLGSLFMSPSYMATAQLAVNARSDAPARLAIPPHLPAAPRISTIDTHVTVLLSDAYLRRLRQR
jgi:uncharacterized protein involved in exopolysaccharide biosynthesis